MKQVLDSKSKQKDLRKKRQKVSIKESSNEVAKYEDRLVMKKLQNKKVIHIWPENIH